MTILFLPQSPPTVPIPAARQTEVQPYQGLDKSLLHLHFYHAFSSKGLNKVHKSQQYHQDR